MTDRCTCCDLPLDGCGKAAEVAKRKREAAETKALLDRPDVFPAQYLGTCIGCGEVVHPGDPLRRNGSGGYLGRCCL